MNVNNSESTSVDDCSLAMLNVLCRRQSGLNIVHFNARSLNPEKMDVVRNTFEFSSVDIICVSETWFKTDISDSHYDIKIINFSDLTDMEKGWGVAIYCKNT